MEEQNLIKIIEQLKQKIINDQNNYNYQINNLLNVINDKNKEIEYYKYNLSEIKNNFSNYNNYIDKIEHTCVIQNQEVERLEREKKMKLLINKTQRKKTEKTQCKKKNVKEKEKGFSIDKKLISFD